jgi:ornithine cyclodeaminase
MTQLFTDSHIAAVLNHDAVIDTLDAAYQDLARGSAAILPRQRCAAGSTKFSVMGALWEARSVAATKSYPTVKGQFSFLINLFDTQANQALAVMAANEITRFRTSGQTALVAKRLGRTRVKKVALFGAGVQGVAQIEALSRRVAFEELCVVDPGLDAPPSIALKEASTIRLTDARSAVTDADIVITATRSQQPVFDGAWLKPDALVAAIGISSAAGTELDAHTMDRASRVIVEWMPQSMAEAGDVMHWLASPGGTREDKLKKVVDLPTLYAQAWPQSGGIQVFKSVGTGLADCATAWLAYEGLKNQALNDQGLTSHGQKG